MIFDFDPRLKKDGLNAKAHPKRLLEDILTGLITQSMATGTASNYITQSYGSNHRILYEGVASLLSEVLVSSVDNLEDSEFTQMRAEFISTRLLYQVFPSEEEVPEGDNVQEVIDILLRTYSALLTGATKKSIDETLNDIAENATVMTLVRGYLTEITTSILATTELNTGSNPHRHYAFANEKGLGATNKPLGYRWGDDIHYHEIVDGVVQPYVDEDGHSHTHEIYLGLPENVLRLQSNLSKVFEAIRPAHLKTQSVSSILEEGDRLLAEANPDNVSGNLFDNVDASVEEGRVAVSLGSIYQEDMRRTRQGTWEQNQYAYVDGRNLRFWNSNIEVADNLIAIWETEEIDPQTNTSYTKINQQKLRVIRTQRDLPEDRDVGVSYRFVRDLGTLEELGTPDTRLVNGLLASTEVDGVQVGYLHNPNALVDSGEPIQLSDTGEVFFTQLRGNHGEDNGNLDEPFGERVALSAQVVEVDTVLIPSGLVLISNLSLAWRQHEVRYEGATIVKQSAPSSTFELDSFYKRRVSTLLKGLPLRAQDFNPSLVRQGAVVDLDGVNLFYDFKSFSITSDNFQFLTGDELTVTFPIATGDFKLFSELNSLNFTLNSVRPPHAVVGGRDTGLENRRVTTQIAEVSYVLNEVMPVSPLTRVEEKTSYSVSTTDSLNNINQVINSTFTLNHGVLGLNLSQDQVFKPATKTLTTSDPKVSFYQLGYAPSFVTSITDQDGVSYGHRIEQGYVVVEGLESEKTLTITAISNTPLVLDQDWFKGERLAEGQAFWELQNSDIENTPSEIHQDPLGIEPDQNRSKYAQRKIEESGTLGELDFFTDSLTRYDLDGRDGFAYEYNPYQPYDEIVGQDYSVYKLGPLSVVDGETFNTIPTYLYFFYFFLNNFNGTDHYFSIYRIDGDGTKYYQTITPIADSSGFFAIEELPVLPAPNGAPLAYRFKDFGGDPTNLTYQNGDFSNNYTAEINASFNHIPHQVYYMEVSMDEDGGGADSLFFFSQGTNAPYTLNTSWDTSNETYRLDEPFGALNMPAQHLYEVTFATNPGEVVTYQSVVDPDPLADIAVENVGLTATIGTTSYIPSEFLYGIRYLQVIPPFNAPFFILERGELPEVTDEVEFSPGRELYSENPVISDEIGWSLYLYPAEIDESHPIIGDEVFSNITFVRASADDEVALITDDFTTAQVLTFESDLPEIEDALTYGIVMEAVLDGEVDFSDEAVAYISSVNVAEDGTDSVTISDEGTAFVSSVLVEGSVEAPTDAHTDALGLEPVVEGDSVPVATDALGYALSLAPLAEGSSIPVPIDDVTALTSILVSEGSEIPLTTDGGSESLALASSDVEGDVPEVTDNLLANFNFAPQDEVALGEDAVSYVLTLARDTSSTMVAVTDDLDWSLYLYPALADESVPVVTDGFNFSLSLTASLEDEVSVSDTVITMITVEYEDALNLVTDASTETLLVAPKAVESDVPEVTDTTSVLVSSFSLVDDVPVASDESTGTIAIEADVASSVTVATDDHTDFLDVADQTFVDSVPEITDGSVTFISSHNVEGSYPVQGDALSTSLVLQKAVESSVPTMDTAIIWAVEMEDKAVSGDVPAPSDNVLLTVSSFSIDDSVTLTTDAHTASVSITADVTDSIPTMGSNSVETLYLNDANLAGDVPLTTDTLSTSLALDAVSFTDSITLTTDDHTTALALSSSLSDDYPNIDSAVSNFITITSDGTEDVPVAEDASTTDLALSSSGTDSVPVASDSHSTSLGLASQSFTDSVPEVDDSSSALIAIEVDVSSSHEVDLGGITGSIGAISDDAEGTIAILSSQSDDYPAPSDASTTALALSGSNQTDEVPVATDDSSTAIAISSSQTDTVPLTTDASTDAFAFDLDPITDSVPVTSAEGTFTEPWTVPYLYVVLNYNSFSNNDDEYFTLYQGEQESLYYPPVVSKMPDSNNLTGFTITEMENGEKRVASSINAQYSNSSDALVRFGPLDPTKTYKLYTRTMWNDVSPPDMYGAFVAGKSAMEPHGLSNLTFKELFPGGDSNNQTERYYIHDIFFGGNTTTGFDAKFQQDTTPKAFPFNDGESVRLYFYMDYKYTSIEDNNDGLLFREAPAGATYDSPNGTNNVVGGWMQPSIHNNSYTYSSGAGATLFPNTSDANPNNIAQVSFAVDVGTRYHLQAFIFDHNQVNDLFLFLEARTEDNGATYNTEYNSTSTLNYDKIVYDDNNQRNQWNHFFTVRRDGFIIWELAPASV